MPTKPDPKKIRAHLRLGEGFFRTAQLLLSATTPEEFQLRTGISRIYYALYHASVALLISLGQDGEAIAKDHGDLHAAVSKASAKYSVAPFLREVYGYRRLADYSDAPLLGRTFKDLEEARSASLELLRRAHQYFNSLYYLARGKASHE